MAEEAPEGRPARVIPFEHARILQDTLKHRADLLLQNRFGILRGKAPSSQDLLRLLPFRIFSCCRFGSSPAARVEFFPGSGLCGHGGSSPDVSQELRASFPVVVSVL